MTVGPTDIKARESILFTEGTPEVEIRSLVNFVGFLKTVTEMETGCLGTIKNAIFDGYIVMIIK